MRRLALTITVALALAAGAAAAVAQQIGTAASGEGIHCRHGVRHALVKARDARMSLPRPGRGHAYLTLGHDQGQVRIHLRVHRRGASVSSEGPARVELRVRCR